MSYSDGLKPMVLKNNTVLINPEAVQLIMKRHFDRISTAQWNLLADGFCEPGFDTTLTDMLCEMTQKLSKSVISVILPMLAKKDSQTDTATALENLNMHLGDSISGAVAELLHVTQDKCRSVEKLTHLIEKEVSLKVKSVVNLAMNSPSLPNKPAVYVSGSVSSTSLCQMQKLAVTYLKRCASKLKLRRLICCSKSKSSEFTAQSLEPSVRCELSESLKSKVSDLSVTQEVASILDKWSSETAEIREVDDSDSSPSGHAYHAAIDIVNIISDDIHYIDHGHDECSECSRTSKAHFSMESVVEVVKGLLASRVNEQSKKERTCKYYKFAKKQFEKMKSDLETSIQQSEQDFTVPLSCKSGSSQAELKKEDASEDQWNLPGVPESLSLKSEASIPTGKTTLISVKKKLRSSVEFEAIKNIITLLYKIFMLPKNPAANEKDIEDKLKNMITHFSKELTNTLYDHLNDTQTYQIPLPPFGRRVSDCVISNASTEVNTNQCSLSPDVIYAITEDLVGRFLQQIVLWMEKEQSKQRSYSEEVYGALSNIEDLIIKTADSLEDEFSKASDKQDITPYCLSPVLPFNDDVKQSNIVNASASSSSERTTDNIIGALVLRILSRAKTIGSVQEADIHLLTERLSDKAQVELKFLDSAPKKDRVSMMKGIKVVVKDLEKEFGSSKLLLEAALASNHPSFDDAVFKSFKFHLDARNNRTPKKWAIGRFFSRCFKVLFRCNTNDRKNCDSNSNTCTDTHTDTSISTPPSPFVRIQSVQNSFSEKSSETWPNSSSCTDLR